MADKIDYKKDRRGRNRFPITHEKAVRDSNWVRLEEKLNGIAGGITGKQETLVSGENIKTIGGQSVLGAGNIPISDPDAVKKTAQTLTAAEKAQILANIGAASSAEVEALADQKYEGPYASESERPEASAQTMGAIYLVGPDENDEYDRTITKLSNGSYSWTSLGKTAIVLANYASKESLNGLQAKVDEIFDYSVAPSNITWINGKYISVTGVLTDNNDYCYTEPVPIKKGELAVVYIASYLFAAISKTDSTGNSYVPVVTVNTSPGSTPNLYKYEYIAEEDGYVAFSGYWTHTKYAYIAKADPIFAYGEEVNTLGQEVNTLGQEVNTLGQEVNTLGVKMGYVLGDIPYEILDGKAVGTSPYGDIVSNGLFDTIVANVESVEKIKLVLQKSAYNTGYALYSGIPSHSTIIGTYVTIGSDFKDYSIPLDGAKYLVICFGTYSDSRYSDVRELNPILLPEEKIVPGYGVNVFEPFRTVVGRVEYLYKNTIIAGMSPSVLTSIHTGTVREPLQDYSSKALKFVADSVGEYPVVINAMTPDLKSISKIITISVKTQPAKKLVNRSNLRVMFFGDSLIHSNSNLIGAEWLRMLNTEDSQTVVNDDGSIQLPTLNATEGKIQMYGEREYYTGARYTVCGAAQYLCEGKTANVNPFYNPNSDQPDELGSDGINKRVDFGWWFDNNIGVGEYPDLVYMALGPNDFANVYNWSEAGIAPTTNRVVAICKKIKSVCDSRSGGDSGTVIKIIQHQPYAMQGNPLYNFPPLMQRVLWQKAAAAYVSAFKSEGIDTYAELIPCASRFDIDLSYTFSQVSNNPRYNGTSDEQSTETIHMNRIGSYNYADVLITDFLADERFD